MTISGTVLGEILANQTVFDSVRRFCMFTMHETFLVFWFVSQVEKEQHLVLEREPLFWLKNYLAIFKQGNVSKKIVAPSTKHDVVPMLSFFNLGNKPKDKKGFVHGKHKETTNSIEDGLESYVFSRTLALQLN